MTKVLTILVILTSISFLSCDNNENSFDKSVIIEKLQGDWIISTSYEGFLINEDTIRNVPTNYPTYKITLTSNKNISLYLVESTDQLLTEGSFDIMSSNEIIFDQTVGEKLKEIGYFDADPASEKYRIVKLNSITLNIEYTYTTSDNNKRFDGFLINRP